MLHEIPDSALRARLLEVVEMQRQLMDALCALPEGSVVNQPWLRALWPAVPEEWIQSFWENDKGNRSIWITAIAAAPAADKRTIRNLLEEQLRFSELYPNPATIRLTHHNWAAGAFNAANSLLKSFYAPLFYKNEGYVNPDGQYFHKDHFIDAFDPPVKICPYTDCRFQDTKLDHFLPKDKFPMLSCHPDNLIPCSTDSNSGGHKGTETPLNLDEADQARDWFHPRLRSAKDTYRLEFPDDPAPQPRVNFIALLHVNQTRLDKMERMFGLSDFWGRYLDDELQMLSGDVRGMLEIDGVMPTMVSVQVCVLQRATQERRRIGKDDLAIVKSYFYEHVANTPVLLDQILRG